MLTSPGGRSNFKTIARRVTPSLVGRLWLVAILFWSAVAMAADASITQLWSQTVGYHNAPEPIAADVDLDNRYEVIQVDVTKNVSAIDMVSGEVLWSRELDGTLLSPVTGNFLGMGRIEVVVVTTAGNIYVLNGATGKTEHQLRAPFSPGLPPVTFPWTGAESQTPYREGLILYDPGERTLNGYLLQPGRILDNSVFRYKTIDTLNATPVVGATDLDGPEPHISFVTMEGALTTFSGRRPEVAIHGRLANQERTWLGVTLADLNGDDTSELVVADSIGYLHAFRVGHDLMEPGWPAGTGDGHPSQRSILSKPSGPLVAIDVDGDKCDDILIPRPKGFYLINGRSGGSFWEPKRPYAEYGHPHNITSAPAVFYGAGRKPYAVFCDIRGVSLLDLRARSLAARFDLPREPVATPIVGPLLAGTETEVFTRTDIDGTCYLLDLGIPFLANSPPWLGMLGGPTRAGHLNRAYNVFRAEQMKQFAGKLEQSLAKARGLGAEGRYEEALDTINSVLDQNPHRRDALALKRSFTIRKNLVLIVLMSIVIAGLIGWLGWMAARHGWAWLLRERAHRALEGGAPDRAIELLGKVSRIFPNRTSIVTEVADLYLSQKRFDATSAPAFERARRFAPSEPSYLAALATAYSSIPRHDEQAADIYTQMAQISRNPGPWFFLLGQTQQQLGRSREALEAYRQAVIHQFDEPKLPGLLTDLYIELGITSPEILPTLERVLPERRKDRAFLRTFCQACKEARRYDEQAQQLARELLEMDAASPPAHIILATRNLQSGHTKEAMLHAQQVLQVNPNDSVGLRLLGACYAAEHRLDSTAMKIFARALETNPDAPEILLAVSHGYAQEGRQDGEAKMLYERALVHHAQDETILAQLAEIARTDQDDALTIRAVEPLLAMGRRDRDLLLQLADAYCRQGIVEDKAEPIYREALLHQPGHATIQDNLAAIYLRKGRIDQEAAQVFAAVHERHPERFDIGLALARCWHGADLPERALELCARLREIEPDNKELLKLTASVSDKANQMESAISGYEQVLADNPGDTEALVSLSSLYGRRRRSDNAAIEIYNRAIKLRPEEPQHYLAAARAYAARETWDHVIQTIKNMLTRNPGQLGAAIELMEGLIENTPRAFPLRYYLADTLIFSSRLAEARRQLADILRLDPGHSAHVLKAYEQIIERNPQDALAHLEKGRILLVRDDLPGAREALEQAYHLHPDHEEIIRTLLGLYQQILSQRDSTEVRFQLGRLAMRIDKHDLAISCFQQTSRDYRWEADSLRNLARCFMAKGMLDLALQELRRLPIDDEIKGLLYELGQRYEAVHDIQGAREVYKQIFAADITYRDVKGKLERLVDTGVIQASAERTAILNSLSEEAKARYELMQELGRGAMGIVYKARDHELDEMVALKILPDNLIRNAEAVRRFRQEARNARRLAHPHIVRIHDIGEERGRKYISMEFVEGSDLRQKLRQAPGHKLAMDQILRYAKEVCTAMDYAHSIGIVHRDIKPANLMLTRDDQIKVTDFGIAKMVQDETGSESTQTGVIVGTPLYMSPEQVKGAPVDHRADIYSMGAVFYEMAAGKPPFTEGDLAYQHMFVEPKPLKDVPEDYNAIVMKCLAKDPAQRWQSAKEILAALDEIKLS
ncbi:MAG: protein kinase [Candidatus Sumerlaeia bacterium]